MTHHLLVLASFAAATVGLTGCFGGDDSTAGVLMDGTPARELDVDLEGIEKSTVLTSTIVTPVASLEPGSAARACLDGLEGVRVEGSAVARLGVLSESVTLREAGGHAVHGCSNALGPREDDQRWCGRSFGELASGRITDPRLNVGCTTDDGAPVGFAWFEVSENTRYLAVRQPEYVEVYEVAAGLPVRVATVSEVEGSQATFDLSEHDAEGRLLSRDRVEAFVAG